MLLTLLFKEIIMIKAVVFDLDGTLMNTLDDLFTGVNRALEKCGYPTVDK